MNQEDAKRLAEAVAAELRKQGLKATVSEPIVVPRLAPAIAGACNCLSCRLDRTVARAKAERN